MLENENNGSRKSHPDAKVPKSEDDLFWIKLFQPLSKNRRRTSEKSQNSMRENSGMMDPVGKKCGEYWGL